MPHEHHLDTETGKPCRWLSDGQDCLRYRDWDKDEAEEPTESTS